MLFVQFHPTWYAGAASEASDDVVITGKPADISEEFNYPWACQDTTLNQEAFRGEPSMWIP